MPEIGFRKHLVIMQKYQRFFLIPVMWVTGCATMPQLHHVEQGNRDAAARAVQQAEQLQLQRQKISELESVQTDLVMEIDILRDQLDEFRTRGASPGGSAATRAESSQSRSGGNQGANLKPELDPTGKVVLGQYEWVWFDLLDRNIPIRIDTGHKASSLYVKSVQPFERDGKNWARFVLALQKSGDDPGEEDVTLEAPVMRAIRTRNTSTGEFERRPVVKLKITIGPLLDEVEFHLVQRENARLPGLLGRNFLRDIAVVDVAREYIQPKQANGQP